MMTRIATLLMVFLLTACAGISVKSDWDPNVDFSRFNTFFILDQAGGGQAVSRFTDERIKSALAADLTAKGLRRVNTREEADLAFGYQVSTEDRREFQTIHSGWGGYGFGTSRYRGWGSSWGGGWGTSTTTSFDYTVGTLVIAGFDVAANELVWESSGSGVIDPSGSAEARQGRIDDAVRRIMEGFPPASK
jgi:hypothetical protein